MLKKLTCLMGFCLVGLLIFSINVLGAEYNEAPMLTEMVEEGELLPVAERLPEEPAVVEPLENIGQYGGTWRKSQALLWWQGVEPLIKLEPEGLDEIPNVAKDWEIDEDFTTFKFELREGMKWSDGADFTSDDFLFWYEDLILNEEFTPGEPDWLQADGEMAEVYAPDDYTIVFEFRDSRPLFIRSIAMHMRGGEMTRYPKHYLKQFHPKYTEKEELEARIDEADLDSWIQLMENKGTQENPEIPVINAWEVTTLPEETLQVLSRNAYYWKVDPEGNQLPYIDKQQFEQIADAEVRLLKGMQGEIDLDRVTKSASDMPALRQREEENNYTSHLLEMSGLTGASSALMVNQNYGEATGNEEIASFLKNVDFRKALSYGVNRGEVNDFSVLGLAEERQAVLNSGHPGCSEEIAKTHTEYRPEKAKELLDNIGLDEKDSDGFRKLPSGDTFELTLHVSAERTLSVDAGEVIRNNLRDIGLKAIISSEGATLYMERKTAGEHQISVDAINNGMDPISKPFHYFPLDVSYEAAPLTGQYVATGGDAGVEPEGGLKELVDIYNQAAGEVDVQKRNSLIREAMELHVEQLYQIGLIGYAGFPIVVHNRMKNTPDRLINAYQNAPTFRAEQYYIEQ